MEIIYTAVYLLILINPVSKIAILCTCEDEGIKKQLSSVAVKSTLVAGSILLVSAVFGNFLMSNIFRIRLEALQISGGFILFWVGFNALRKGVFFELDYAKNYSALAIVPLACPLIAGPATISACISISMKGHEVHGLLLSLILALAVNLALMKLATPIGHLLTRSNILGAIIRITGLMVMTIGVQMGIEGLKKYFI